MFKRIDHVELVTDRLDRTIAFCTEVLGFTVRPATGSSAPIDFVYLDLTASNCANGCIAPKSRSRRLPPIWAAWSTSRRRPAERPFQPAFPRILGTGASCILRADIPEDSLRRERRLSTLRRDWCRCADARFDRTIYDCRSLHASASPSRNSSALSRLMCGTPSPPAPSIRGG